MTQHDLENSSPRPVTVGGINWASVLDFTQLFRGFRLAINPAKIVLALLAIVLIYCAGRAFDWAWGPQVYTDEIESFQVEKPDLYNRMRKDQLEERKSVLQMDLTRASAKDSSLTTQRIDELQNNPPAAYKVLKACYEKQFQDTVTELRQDRLAKEKEHRENPTETFNKSPAEAEQDDRAAAAKKLFVDVRNVKNRVGGGIFDSFLAYELRQFDALIDNTLSFARIAPLHPAIGTDVPPEGQAITAGVVSTNPDRLWRSDTIAGCLANMTFTGPMWLFTASAPMQWRPDNADTWGGWIKMVSYRGLYLLSLLVFAIFCLLVLAVTGATLSRMSALEIAGYERASLKHALVFAVRRLWIFIKAPLTPFLILLVVGIIIAAVGLIGAIPWVGEIILGMLFVLFLIGGFILMLLMLGIIGGFNLLYPTIAVEGSDAFDAMSRSFAYVYARPWRLIFYTVVSLIYGAITYLFVSFAVYLILLLTHVFAGWGTNLLGTVYGANSGLPKLDTLWPTPQFSRLIAPTNWYAMNWSETIGSAFLHFWVYLLVCTIGAYVISYYFSTHTIIYLLLRRSVDGQATTEVFIEDEPAEPAPAANPAPPAITPPTTAVSAPVTPAAPTPAPTEPPPVATSATNSPPPPDAPAGNQPT